jgi:hypothetical protein
MELSDVMGYNDGRWLIDEGRARSIRMKLVSTQFV